jgi:diguanylate cyclase (GGDEF)-like protein/PAS domain S-box-containing protein
MSSEEEQRAGWADGLTLSLEQPLDRADGDAPSARVALLIRARWMILLILCVYALYASTFYSYSRFGFFLSRNQTAFLLLSLGGVILYNLSYQNASRRISHFRYADHLQVLLDMLLVTVLIHFSGGAASWVWTLYLIVTIEAVYLLKRNGEVWFAWCAGALLYGALLTCEHAGVIHNIRMPFVDPRLPGDSIYLLLIWFWVVLLNAAVSVIGFHLMSVSRGETLQLKESEQRLFAFLEYAQDLIQMNAPDGRFIYANRAWLRTFGYRKEELSGLTLSDLVHPDSSASFAEEFGRVLTQGERGSLDDLYLTRDGNTVNVEGNLSCSFRGKEPVAVWGICRDVTKKRREDQQLYRMAHHDVLTDLPNRQLFMDRFQQLRAMSNRVDRHMAVLYLDLDRFKSVNDTLGHAFGDRLLQSVAARLTASVRETDTVARMGGDEFVIALGNLRGAEGAETVARKVLQALSAPHQIETHELLISSSIGISVYPDDGSDLDELLEKADTALYCAKEQGRSCYRKYADLKQYREGAVVKAGVKKKGHSAEEVPVAGYRQGEGRGGDGASA